VAVLDAARRRAARPGGSAEQAPDPGARSRRRRRRLLDDLTGWGFAGPATLVVLGLSLFPAGWALLISREKWNGISAPKDLGWQNYTQLAADPDLFDAVNRTVLFTVLFVPASLAIGLLIAMALNQKIRLIGFYRTCIFVPFVASAAATGILASFVFNPQFGIANAALRAVGIAPQPFLEDATQVLPVLVVISLWSSIGFVVVVYLAALQDIPRDLVEAAICDGAGPVRVLRHVTLPALLPVTVFTAVWQTITALQLFDLIFTTTRGGPLGGSTTVVYFIYEQAFKLHRYGYASAVAYLLFGATMLLTIGMVGYARRKNLDAF
jgi:multiple sugar transport system permease protein